MSEYRAKVTRAGRVTWDIQIQSRETEPPDGTRLWNPNWHYETSAAWTVGTERHARAKAARMVRRRERKDAWRADAEAQAVTITSPEPPKGRAAASDPWVPPSALLTTEPDPTSDRHCAFGGDQ